MLKVDLCIKVVALIKITTVDSICNLLIAKNQQKIAFENSIYEKLEKHFEVKQTSIINEREIKGAVTLDIALHFTA